VQCFKDSTLRRIAELGSQRLRRAAYGASPSSRSRESLSSPRFDSVVAVIPALSAENASSPFTVIFEQLSDLPGCECYPNTGTPLASASFTTQGPHSSAKVGKAKISGLPRKKARQLVVRHAH